MKVLAETCEALKGCSSGAALPRALRRRKRKKGDSGLPPENQLQTLAKEYLRIQAELWPELAGFAFSATPDAAVIESMVNDYRHRHRTGQTELDQVQKLLGKALKLGGIYARYSCDNSNPLSIVDQLAKCLRRARQENCFVPWMFVFADYSVSGLVNARQGYSSYKDVLRRPENHIDITFVDDFTRASRDMIEWWRFEALCCRLKKRVIGASDGVDTISPSSEVVTSALGMVSRLFIKGTRQKVGRGMHGAAGRAVVLGKPPLGFTRCPVLDAQGRPKKNQKDRGVHRFCIDPETAKHRREMFELYVEKRWSIHRITKHFVRLGVDGWTGWTASAVRKLLHSPTAIGVFIWNRTRQARDEENGGKVVILTNPAAERVVFYDRNLAIVPVRLWAAARKRLHETRRNSPRTGKGQPPKGQMASSLFSGTLRCSYCGSELKLARSGKYPMLGCMNGLGGVHGCPLRTKSTRKIETSLLQFVREQLLTVQVIDDLVVRANGYLSLLAKRPRHDTRKLKEEIKELEKSIDGHLQRIEATSKAGLKEIYENRIVELQECLQPRKAEVGRLEAENLPAPPPLVRDRIMAYLDDLRGLLDQEVPAAAEALRAVTGMIEISHEVIPGRKTGARWIAKFQPDLLPLLCRLAGKADCPDTVTLEFLCRRNWTVAQPVVVPLERPKKLQQIAARAGKLKAKGCSIQSIATALRTTRPTVKQALHYRQTGELPEGYKPSGKRTGKRGQPKYIVIAEQVKRLRDVDLVPFTQIASDLGVSIGTASHAYDHASPEALETAVECGSRPKRRYYRRQSKPGVPLRSQA